ncbi:MAG: 30S ribosomal protein S1 [Gammaproteobacteria bacterium]|nr:30S ribosomal protein S1 [Gammaproteobacteria bacterium]MXY65681.1 30S ribosomal protein S1 [Gammaproteobacteria bacterium]MYG67431.1 30S ribosomal protein S1 [Gammaproteobacteria bacterium]MYH90010.1 30S ribosomal protein S1 [Gammaproteobacteria bacterium]
MSEDFAALLEENLSGVVMKPGSVITGEVLEINNDFVIVGAGLKSDAEIHASEFRNPAGEITVKVGDKVEVALEAVEDGTGATRMSREKAMRARAWEELSKAHENGDIVSGIITGKVKGGFTVDINNLRAFLPGSLVDVRPVKDSAYIEGRELDFKVIKLDQSRNNIVVSRRAIVENELNEERDKLLDTLEEGQIVKGIVKNLTDYGAFVNLGGLDGLLHITDLAWKRVKHPSEVLNVGDEIEARVLKFDREQCRVSLGIKQLGEDPWLDLSRRYPVGTRLFGRVTNLTDYGAFVELEEGVEGLVHLSEMDWTNKNIHPAKFCHVGDEVEVMVLDIDSDRRRISLGMKQCTPNPWEEFAALHKKGDVMTGKIRSITDFGVFIGVEGGIDGLVHLSELSWDRPGEEVVTELKKGDELTVVVLAVDAERERISLGLKQAIEDPFATYVSENGKGRTVQGTVKDVTAKGATVELAPSVEGYIRASEITQDRVEDARTALNVGDTVEAKITSIERKDRKISLSIKVREMEIEGEAVQEYSRESAIGSATLGDKLKEQLNKQSS